MPPPLTKITIKRSFPRETGLRWRASKRGLVLKGEIQARIKHSKPLILGNKLGELANRCRSGGSSRFMTTRREIRFL